MERLTNKDFGKVCFDPWEICGMDKYCTKGCHDEGGCTKGCHIVKMILKLARYEEKEENGLLIDLPCVEGTTVYIIKNVYTCKFNYCCPLKVERYMCDEDEEYCEHHFKTYQVFEKKFNAGMRDLFGKTLFLTRSEAQINANLLNQRTK